MTTIKTRVADVGVHLHVRLTGDIERCTFDDWDYDQNREELSAWLHASKEAPIDPDGWRYDDLVAAFDDAPLASVPTCEYWQSGNCYETRFQIEPLPVGDFAPMVACGYHLTDHMADNANLGAAWAVYPYGAAVPQGESQ